MEILQEDDRVSQLYCTQWQIENYHCNGSNVGTEYSFQLLNNNLQLHLRGWLWLTRAPPCLALTEFFELIRVLKSDSDVGTADIQYSSCMV